MSAEIEKMIEVKNARKVYRMGSERIVAVDNVSFEILKGEFCCLLGTSGSGKSTLLNLMAGIEKLTEGEIIIKGKKVHKMNENSLARFRQRYLGFVFQSYNLLQNITALENVEFPLIFKRVHAKKRKRLAKEMLVKVGLGNRLHHKPTEMSGGQQQRVGIARAFVAKPEIIFADEPTGNLDTKTTKEVMNLIQSMARANNQTIVMVTHDPKMAEYADKTIRILDGKIESIEYMQKKEALERNLNESQLKSNDSNISQLKIDSDKSQLETKLDNNKSQLETKIDGNELQSETKIENNKAQPEMRQQIDTDKEVKEILPEKVS